MARIAGVDIPREKRVEISLTYIYGVGLTTSKNALAETGVNPDTRVRDLTDDGPCIERELALVKVAGTGERRNEAMRIAGIFNARVVDATLSSFIFELTGTAEDLGDFIGLMSELGLVEISRTGVVAISRGAAGF